jgi:hypothetical protein
MSKFRLKVHNDGFNEVRTAPAIVDDLLARGHRIASAAGGEPDFVVHESSNATRARVVVVTATAKGMEAEAHDRKLTRALDAGRG